MKFKKEDKILPKKDGRYSRQRSRGIQVIKRRSEGYWEWITDQGVSYCEDDIEFAKPVKPIEKCFKCKKDLSDKRFIKRAGKIGKKYIMLCNNCWKELK